MHTTKKAPSIRIRVNVMVVSHHGRSLGLVQLPPGQRRKTETTILVEIPTMLSSRFEPYTLRATWKNPEQDSISIPTLPRLLIQCSSPNLTITARTLLYVPL